MILRTFFENDYNVEWRVINAGEYNLPQKRRRIYIFAYHKNTNYYKETKKLNSKDIIFEKGIFSKQFKLENEYSIIEETSILEYKDLINVSNNFKFNFYNSGIMNNGKIYTVKTKPKCNEIYPLSKIREEKEVDKKFFLSTSQIEKFSYLKGNKRIPRIKPNGEVYYYTEGSMPFPDKLTSPARTMLTSEGTVSRTTHVITDYKTNKLRLLTPVECERINTFPDNWTNTGMTDKKRNFTMGNALVVKVIEKIGEEIEKNNRQ